MGIGSSKEEVKPVLPVSMSNANQSGKPLEKVVVQSGGRKKTRHNRKANRRSQRKNRRCGY